MRFLPDGNTLVSALKSQTIRAWDTTTGQVKQTFKSSCMGDIAFSRGGTKMVFKMDGKAVDALNIITGQAELMPEGDST